MSFFDKIFSGEWFLNFKTPNEDKEHNRQIYLNLVSKDIMIKLKDDTDRYTLLKLLKNIHNNFDDIIDDIPNLLKELLDISDKQIKHIITIFRPIEVIFMEKSQLEVEHYKNDDGIWITQIFKKENNELHEIAYIAKHEKTNITDIKDKI